MGDGAMEMQNNALEMTARDYIRILFRRKGIIFSTILTVMTLSIVGVMFRTPIYEAQVKLLISGQKQAQASYYTDMRFSGGRSAQTILTQSEIVKSDPVVERAAAVLGLANKPIDYEKRFASKIKKPFINLQAMSIEKKLQNLPEEQRKMFLFRLGMEELRNSIEVEPVRDTDVFHIKVKGFNPLGVTVSANVVSRSYIIFDLEQQYAEMRLKYGEKNQQVLQLKSAIDKMSQGLNGAPIPPIEAIGPATVKIIEQAKVPLKPIGLRRAVAVLLAFLMSIFLSLMLAFAFEYSDQRFRSSREAKLVLGIDQLGSVRAKANPHHYRDLSERLASAINDRSAKTVLFVSATLREGVIQIVVQLAKHIAEHQHKKILVIDGNLRNPLLHKYFKLPKTDIVANVNGNRPLIEKGIQNVGNGIDILTLGSGATSPLAIIESHMKYFIEWGHSRYDLVLIISAPLAEFNDAVVISELSDGAVLVVNETQSRRHAVKSAVERLQDRKANLLGFVLSNRKFAMPKWIYDRV